jgi:hypothetical protein
MFSFKLFINVVDYVVVLRVLICVACNYFVLVL